MRRLRVDLWSLLSGASARLVDLRGGFRRPNIHWTWRLHTWAVSRYWDAVYRAGD